MLISRRNVLEAAAALPVAHRRSSPASWRSIHGGVLTVDAHVDIPPNFASELVDPSRNGREQNDLVKMHQGGMKAAFFIVYVAQTPPTGDSNATAVAAAERKFDAIEQMVADNPASIALARTRDEVLEITTTGRIAALIGVENGHALGGDLQRLDRFFARGARYLTLTHNGNNDIGGSALPNPAWGDSANPSGLTKFGLDVVSRMNDLGMMVDVSHTSRATTHDAIQASRAPVIASHSGVASVFAHPRNLDDAAMAAIARTGGVVCVTAVDEFLKPVDPRRTQAIQDLDRRIGLPDMDDDQGDRLLPRDLYNRYQALRADIDARWPPAGVTDLVDQLDYAVRLIGIDHVGLASDFDGGGGVAGWRDAAQAPNVTRELLRRGYSRSTIAAIWGGNILRVLQACGSAARAPAPDGIDSVTNRCRF